MFYLNLSYYNSNCFEVYMTRAGPCILLLLAVLAAVTKDVWSRMLLQPPQTILTGEKCVGGFLALQAKRHIPGGVSCVSSMVLSWMLQEARLSCIRIFKRKIPHGEARQLQAAAPVPCLQPFQRRWRLPHVTQAVPRPPLPQGPASAHPRGTAGAVTSQRCQPGGRNCDRLGYRSCRRLAACHVCRPGRRRSGWQQRRGLLRSQPYCLSRGCYVAHPHGSHSRHYSPHCIPH